MTNARVTQANLEAIAQHSRNARVTRVDLEVVSPSTSAPVFGGGVLIAGVASATALTDHPQWSLLLFGRLATCKGSTFLLYPSYDIRPGVRAARTSEVRPWLGAPFLASDTWANATVIPSAPYDVRGSTAGFTLQANEPQPSAGATGATGWYTFTPTTSGYYEFSLIGSAYDTMLGIYRQGINPGVGGLVEVASNNDFAGPSSHLFTWLDANTQYWVQIGGLNGLSGVYELSIALASATCLPVQVSGTVVANFWQGYTGGFPYPSVVGGFGGAVEVARAVCPTSWTTVTVDAYLVSTTGPSNVTWDLAYEIHDASDRLLGGRGDFFSGPQSGWTSWQTRVTTPPGGTAHSVTGYSSLQGGDTTQAKWFVLYAFPTDPAYGTQTATVAAKATFAGTCPLPPIHAPTRSRTWAWWT